MSKTSDSWIRGEQPQNVMHMLLPLSLSSLLCQLISSQQMLACSMPAAVVIAVQIFEKWLSVQMGLKLRHPGTGQARWHAKWVRIQLPDGQPVRFNVEESSNKPQEWCSPPSL